ncbi:MAG TPA: redoxin domain-containing protein [Thermoanaerobaculia bacterium]|nr:redoxin domain-containing protein [Thermoanaerobaculia bacterium]
MRSALFDSSEICITKIEADGKGKVAFSLLSDPKSEVIERYALRDPAYAGQPTAGVPHPAVFVLDRDGKIRWSKIESDYRQRASNAEIRASLDAVP